MKMSLEMGDGYLIHSYTPGCVEIIQSAYAPDNEARRTQQISCTEPVLISPEAIVTEWSVRHDEPLADEHMKAILNTEPEVVILGTGSKIELCHHKTAPQFHQENVGVEIMDSGAACRTYNILMSEGRRVTVALLAL